MLALDANWVYELALVAPVLLLSLTLHEFAHARTALAFGDPTAKAMGRVTLNPLAHLDPMGTIVFLLSRRIGWAKPVPVNPYNLHPRRLGDVMVSLAGPLSNLLLAITTGLALRAVGPFELPDEPQYAKVGRILLWYGMSANLGLFVFNLLPLFPLDGHHIAREMLPAHRRGPFMNWQMKYGRVLLMVLILVPLLFERVLGQGIFSPIAYLHGQIVHLAIRVLVI